MWWMMGGMGHKTKIQKKNKKIEARSWNVVHVCYVKCGKNSAFFRFYPGFCIALTKLKEEKSNARCMRAVCACAMCQFRWYLIEIPHITTKHRKSLRMMCKWIASWKTSITKIAKMLICSMLFGGFLRFLFTLFINNITNNRQQALFWLNLAADFQSEPKIQYLCYTC